jgi:hypothetical protein
MKTSMLGLAISTVAFGATSIYLWNQLSHEREQLAAVQEANAGLNARIVELERHRAEFAELRTGGPGTFGGALAARADALPERAPPSPGEEPVFTTVNPGPGHRPPDMPAAMMKMMRANVRAQNKRTYFDLQSKLGLTAEQTDALLDMLTDQQTQGFRNAGRNTDPEQARTWWEEEQSRRKAALTDLLGTAKAAEFEEYQKSMPSRSELSMLSQQLEGADIPLSDSQRSRMLEALIEERDRIPMPSYADGTPQEDMAKTYNEWQTDYEKRVAEQARGILTAEQLGTYNEYAQWQKEMREQFASGMPPMRAPMMRGNAVAVAAPVMGFVSTVDAAAPGDGKTATPTEKAPRSK